MPNEKTTTTLTAEVPSDLYRDFVDLVVGPNGQTVKGNITLYLKDVVEKARAEQVETQAPAQR